MRKRTEKEGRRRKEDALYAERKEVKMAAFWVVAPCSLVLQPRRQPSSHSPP
jgi:hypothetical protein